MNQSIQTLVIGLAIVTGSIGLLLTTTTSPPLQQYQTAYAIKDPETGNNINEEDSSSSNTQDNEEDRFIETPTPDGTMITDKKDGSSAHINPESGNICEDPPGSLEHLCINVK